MAQSTFFGLTSYGAGTAYDKTAARPLQFHQVPDEVFLGLFRQHALGQSELAQVLQVLADEANLMYAPLLHILIKLQVPGADTILTKDVLGVFQEALGRKANVAEVNAVQTCVCSAVPQSLPLIYKLLA